MVKIPKFELQPYLEIARRRKWWIVVPLMLAIIGGGAYVMTTPKMYRASTLILVEAQRVPTSYVQPTVTESLHSRLNTISQQINSRTNLESIIQEYSLFPDKSKKQRTNFLAKGIETVKNKLFTFISEGEASSGQEEDSGPSMLSRVKNVRNNIEVSIRGGKRAFEIAFQWSDPQIASEVANALASQFIEQNLRVREEMAMGTTNFLDYEVDRLRKKLEEKERALEQFKEKNMGRLPGQLQSNLNILNQLKEELSSLEKRVDMEQQQAMMLRNQMSNMNMQQPQLDPSMDFSAPESGELSSLKDRLEQLKTKYTAKHPDVVTIKRRIDKLKQEQADKEQNGSEVGQKMEMPEFNQQDMIKPQLQQIQARIHDYEKRIQQVRKEIEKYKQRIEATHEVELQLKDLQRDYETVQTRYQDLLAKKLNAQMAEELEKRQKGEQFRVVDPAVPPEKPYSPDMQKIMLMALVLGIGFGGGMAYVRETLDPAFYTPSEVEEYLQRKVIVSLPIEERKKGRKKEE